MTLLRKPVSIVLIGTYYLVSPVINLAQIAWATQLPLSGSVNLWNTLHPFDWMILLTFPLVGWGVLSVRRWGWIAFTSFSSFLVGYNTFSFFVNRTYDLALVVLYNVGLVAVTSFFFRKHLRAPYFNPRLRWWNVDPRYPVHISAKTSINGRICEAEILDISKSGVFLSTCAEIEVGQDQAIEISAYGHTFPCTGKVMRKTLPNAPIPGFGIMFESLDPLMKHEIRFLLERLVENGARERSMPPGAPLAKDPWQKHLAWYTSQLWHELVGS